MIIGEGLSINFRKHIDVEINRIKSELLSLGSMAESKINNAVWALTKKDVNMANLVIDGDDQVDSLAAAIDADCFTFIARYQPVALDLRIISSVIHMALDLERIADLAVKISKTAVKIGQNSFVKPLIDIPSMGKITVSMIDGAMKAFLNGDIEQARQVCAQDDQVDDLEKQIFRELLVLMMENPKSIEQSTLLIGVAAALERVGDHATNLAENIIYAYGGQPVKASDFRRPKD